MENASKAIIMAGGVLIAVAIITLALYAYAQYREYARSSEQLLTISQIESFNRFYESYGSATSSTRYIGGNTVKFYDITGVDYLNIYRKACEDNLADSALTVDCVTSELNHFSGDSDTFIESAYVGYTYDTQGKINKVYLRSSI